MRRQGRLLREIGDEVGLTRERVRQILVLAKEMGEWEGEVGPYARPESPERKLVRELVEADPQITITKVIEITGTTRTAAVYHLKAIMTKEDYYQLARRGDRERWTALALIKPESLEEVRSLYAQGLTIRDIAELFKCSDRTVRSFMIRHGIERRRGRPRKSDPFGMPADFKGGRAA